MPEKRYKNIFEVKQQLEAYISELRASGECQLPSERFLSEELNCNRRTLRGALEQLDSKGLTRKMARQRLIADTDTNNGIRKPLLLIAPAEESIHDPTSAIFQKIVSSTTNYMPVLIDSLAPKEEVIRQTRQLISEGVDTCFVISNTSLLSFLEQFSDRMRFYRLKADDLFKGQDVPAVMIDYHHGGYIGIQHLLKTGKSRILVLSIDPEHDTHVYRDFERGCRDAVQEFGRPVELEFFRESKERHFNDTLTPDSLGEICKKYDAVFACEDHRLIKLHNLLLASNVRIPGNMALLGFKNTPWSTALHPRLSTISTREDLIVERAIAMMEQQRNTIELVKPKLIVRESTCPRDLNIKQIETSNRITNYARI
jgi:DNA-binding LacI/PurR family transcriptional regulator